MKAWLHNLNAIGLAVLLAACLVAWLTTGDVNPFRVSKKAAAPAARVSKVDERPLRTARQIAALAVTQAEQELVEEAVGVAGQEVDQDFATAIREAGTIAPPTIGPLHDLAAHIADLKTRVAADQQRVAQLAKDPDRLELAKAQLALDQDELDDAQQDLAREGGDERANLKLAYQKYQAARRGDLAFAKVTAADPPETAREQIQEWFALGARQDQVQAAKQNADKKAATLAAEHNALEGKLGSAPAAPSGGDSDEDDTATVVEQLRRLSDQRKTLIDLDERTQLCRQLSGVYQKWLAMLAGQRRGVLHLLLGSLGAILGILLAAALVNRVIERVLGRQADARRQRQLQVVTGIAVQVAAVLLILLVIFGAPRQLLAAIGVAGAGMAVVLKYFIVALFGYFVLMGPDGIAVGDWVEINGVGGEVVEIGILRTALLELGNLNNARNPNGRRAAFTNSFAIEGHYYNFSATGQWRWDQLQVALPSGGDPYRMTEQIRQIAERETEEDAKMAEQDWERVMRQYGAPAFSAKAAADVRPGAAGLMVNLRYITRGPVRDEVKSRLFKQIVELMHGAEKAVAV
jgi:small-conductance mechanosensitive channel